MKSLQGTWSAALLDENRIQFSGWVEGSYTVGSVANQYLPLTFNYRAFEPMMQQAFLRFERQVVPSGTSEPTFGFRSDWLVGTDYRFTLSRGILNEQLTQRANGEPNNYGVDPVQFYLEGYFPTIGNGLDVKLGRFFAPFGVESIEAVSNALLSHSYTFTNGPPFTNTGLLATLTLTPVWQLQAGLVLGPDIFIDPADKATAIASVQWTQPGGRNAGKLTTIMDSGRFDQKKQQPNFNELDLVYTHTFNPVVTYNLEILGGYETNVPDMILNNGEVVRGGTTTFLGAANYLTYTFSPCLNGTVRLEFFDDPQGSRTTTAPGATVVDSKGLYTAVTLGLSFKPRKSIIFQPELRYDYNGESRPYEGNHDLLTAGLGVTLRY